MTEEVTRAIATKFLGGIEGFELIKLENYKNYVVYFAFPDGVTGEINVGLPIYILIDKLGNVRYADSNEQHELLIRSQSEELESSSNTATRQHSEGGFDEASYVLFITFAIETSQLASAQTQTQKFVLKRFSHFIPIPSKLYL